MGQGRKLVRYRRKDHWKQGCSYLGRKEEGARIGPNARLAALEEGRGLRKGLEWKD